MLNQHVMLIGAGQLGSRHLQALASCNSNINISVIDPSQNSLQIAQERLKEVSLSPSIGSVEFFQNISDVKSNVDCCIIATSAQPRLAILKELTASLKVCNILFEKVLFQSSGQIDEATEILEHHDIKAWVNCGRRMQAIYLELQPLLQNEETLNMEVTGTNWGLACNGIHLIDLWAYLSGEPSYSLDSSSLSSDILESKRAGYKEVNGTLRGKGGKGDFSLTCVDDDNDASLTVCIDTPNFKINIDEVNGKCSIENVAERTSETKDISFLFQSQLSNIVVDGILGSRGCVLTTFSESASIHKPFLETLLSFINENGNETFKLCPIT